MVIRDSADIISNTHQYFGIYNSFDVLTNDVLPQPCHLLADPNSENWFLFPWSCWENLAV